MTINRGCIGSSIRRTLVLFDPVQGGINLSEGLLDAELIFHKCDTHVPFAIGAEPAAETTPSRILEPVCS